MNSNKIKKIKKILVANRGKLLLDKLKTMKKWESKRWQFILLPIEMLLHVKYMPDEAVVLIVKQRQSQSYLRGDKNYRSL